jgi:hypothetical protein
MGPHLHDLRSLLTHRAPLLAAALGGALVRALAAVAVGTLCGLLIGLSQTPVVHDALVVLLAAALGYVGLVRREPAEPASPSLTLMFVLGVLGGLGGGIYARVANPWLGEILQARYLDWVRIDYDRATARRLVAQEYFQGRAEASSAGAGGVDGGTGDGGAPRVRNEATAAPAPTRASPMTPTVVAGSATTLCFAWEVWRRDHRTGTLEFTQLDALPHSQELLTLRWVFKNLDARVNQDAPRKLEALLDQLCPIPGSPP